MFKSFVPLKARNTRNLVWSKEDCEVLKTSCISGSSDSSVARRKEFF